MDNLKDSEMFMKVWRQVNNTFSNHVSLNCIKSFDNCVMEFDQLYFMIKSRHVANYEKTGDGTWVDDEGHLVQITLSDETVIVVMVKSDSFRDAVERLI